MSLANPPCHRLAETGVVSDHAGNGFGVGSGDEDFRLLFIHNPQPMWVYDVATLEFLEVNQAAVAHYGYARGEFLQMRVPDFRPQEDAAPSLDPVSTREGKLDGSRECKHVLKDGRIIDVEVAFRTLTFAGKVACLMVIQDVTERKKTESALTQAEQKYRHIFEDAVVGIFQSTPQGRFLSANSAMARMLGYQSAHELIASITDIRQQFYVDASRRDQFKQLMEEKEVIEGFEAEVYRKDHRKMWLSINVRAMRESGVVVRYEGTFEDVSERKLLAEQFRQAQKMEAIGRLAGGVAHDFNNALGVITGYSDLLQMRLPAGDPLHKYAHEIAKAGHRAASLTRQLLAFSRKQIIQPVVLDLNAVISDTEKMLQRLIGEDIECKFSPDSRLARVKADPGQIEQILMNLAVNARDAMPQGGKVFIETSNSQLDESYLRQHTYVKPGRYVMLSFSDTGCGIDKQTQAHIFEPFFTTKEPGKGTGLGLSTVYGIVKQNGGYVWVYSEPGKGTTFKIYFPHADEAQAAAEHTEISHSLSSGSETVLLVEDEEPLRQLARTCLETGGYTVLCVPNAKSAIEIARQYPDPIHLLLTDVIMPGMSGREVANVVAALRPGIRVLFMSGYTNDLIAQYGVLDPGTLLLEKPFTLYSLLNKVDQALHTHQAKQAGAEA